MTARDSQPHHPTTEPVNPVAASIRAAWGDILNDSGKTHFAGCWSVHWQCAMARMADEIERLERALTETHDAWTGETTARLQAERRLAEVRAELGALQPWRTDDVSPNLSTTGE